MRAAVPEGDGVALPAGVGIVQYFGEFERRFSLDRGSAAARSSGWCGDIQIGVEAQSSDDTDIASDRTEEVDGGKSRVADDDEPAARQPAMDLQRDLAGPVQQRLGRAAARIASVDHWSLQTALSKSVRGHARIFR